MGSRQGVCSWCGEKLASEGPVAREIRRDARYCSKKCRQSAFRLRRQRVADARALEPMAFAYADPPYPGTAKKYYGGEATYAGEVDHAKLIGELEARRLCPFKNRDGRQCRKLPEHDGDHYEPGCNFGWHRFAQNRIDGWALSTSASALRDLLPLCPEGARVAAWVKPHGVSGKTFGLHNAWEPLIVVGGRRKRGGVRDWLRAMPARFGGELPGRKPIAFCAWLFDCLGMVPGDALDDLFPGTGIVARAWRELSSRKYSRDTSVGADDDALVCRLCGKAHLASCDTSPMDDEALAQQLENIAADSDPCDLFQASGPHLSVEFPPKPVQGTSIAPGVAADEVGQESGRSPPTRGAGAEPLPCSSSDSEYGSRGRA